RSAPNGTVARPGRGRRRGQDRATAASLRVEVASVQIVETDPVVAKPSRSGKGICVFCGKHGTLTNEDAVPTWLMKILSPGALTWGQTGGQLLANVQRAPTGYRLKVFALCAACNTNWLSPIEKRAKPKLMSWMAGLHSLLTVEDQRLLSLWAVKT